MGQKQSEERQGSLVVTTHNVTQEIWVNCPDLQHVSHVTLDKSCSLSTPPFPKITTVPFVFLTFLYLICLVASYLGKGFPLILHVHTSHRTISWVLLKQQYHHHHYQQQHNVGDLDKNKFKEGQQRVFGTQIGNQSTFKTLLVSKRLSQNELPKLCMKVLDMKGKR